MTPTLSVDAVHASETVVAVLPGEVRLLGAVGACVSGPGPVPSQALPLTLQLESAPPPEPMKPKLAVPPAGTEPFQPLLTKVWWLPESVRTASQLEVMAAPAAVSNSTFQLVMPAPVPLVTVHLPSKPEPQSEVFTQEAVTAAAEADEA